MVAITNINMPGSFRLDGSALKGSLSGNPQELSAQPETRPAVASSSVEFSASSYSESQEYRGYKVFKRAIYSNETLKLFHPKFNSSQPNSVAAGPALNPSSYLGNKQSPTQTANNILGFVERRLNERKASGASDAELDSLMQQARAGLDKGFDQARSDLVKLDLMTPKLSEEIDQSYDLALGGLEALKVKFGLAEPTLQPPPSEIQTVLEPDEQASNSIPVVSSNDQVETLPSQSLASSSLSYQSGMRGSLMITTRDGDKVYLDETLIDVLRYKSISKDDTTFTRFAASSQFTQELRVVGSLDEDEMTAIQELVDKASDIAGLMQTRDFQAALDQALELDFDESEIASFALQLTRVEVFTSKSVVYKKPSPMQAFAPGLSQLDKKITDVLALLDKLKVSNKNFAEFISQGVPGNRHGQEASNRHVQAFQSITQELLSLHRGTDSDLFQSL